MDCSSFGHIQLLRGFHSDFVERDPVLKYGELAYTLDVDNCLRIGNGVGEWSTLPKACPNTCAIPCVKTFRLYSKINYQYTDGSQNLPASSGFPLFDTLLDIPNNTDINLNISQYIDNNGSSVDPETIMPNGQKAVLGIINGEIVTSGSFSGRINTGGRFLIGVNDDNYEDNSGYFLVKFETGKCTTPPPTTTTTTTTTTTAAPTTSTTTTTAAPTTSTTTTTTSTTTTTTTTTNTTTSTTLAPGECPDPEQTSNVQIFNEIVNLPLDDASDPLDNDATNGSLTASEISNSETTESVNISNGSWDNIDKSAIKINTLDDIAPSLQGPWDGNAVIDDEANWFISFDLYFEGDKSTDTGVEGLNTFVNALTNNSLLGNFGSFYITTMQHGLSQANPSNVSDRIIKLGHRNYSQGNLSYGSVVPSISPGSSNHILRVNQWNSIAIWRYQGGYSIKTNEFIEYKGRYANHRYDKLGDTTTEVKIGRVPSSHSSEGYVKGKIRNFVISNEFCPARLDGTTTTTTTTAAPTTSTTTTTTSTTTTTTTEAPNDCCGFVSVASLLVGSLATMPSWQNPEIDGIKAQHPDLASFSNNGPHLFNFPNLESNWRFNCSQTITFNGVANNPTGANPDDLGTTILNSCDSIFVIEGSSFHIFDHNNIEIIRLTGPCLVINGTSKWAYKDSRILDNNNPSLGGEDVQANLASRPASIGGYWGDYITNDKVFFDDELPIAGSIIFWKASGLSTHELFIMAPNGGPPVASANQVHKFEIRTPTPAVCNPTTTTTTTTTTAAPTTSTTTTAAPQPTSCTFENGLFWPTTLTGSTSGKWLEKQGGSTYKENMRQVIDDTANYNKNGSLWYNTTGSTIFWDGDQTGQFQVGDIVKFVNDDHFGRVILDTFDYEVTQIIPSTNLFFTPNSQQNPPTQTLVIGHLLSCPTTTTTTTLDPCSCMSETDVYHTIIHKDPNANENCYDPNNSGFGSYVATFVWFKTEGDIKYYVATRYFLEVGQQESNSVPSIIPQLQLIMTCDCSKTGHAKWGLTAEAIMSDGAAWVTNNFQALGTDTTPPEWEVRFTHVDTQCMDLCCGYELQRDNISQAWKWGVTLDSNMFTTDQENDEIFCWDISDSQDKFNLEAKFPPSSGIINHVAHATASWISGGTGYKGFLMINCADCGCNDKPTTDGTFVDEDNQVGCDNRAIIAPPMASNNDMCFGDCVYTWDGTEWIKTYEDCDNGAP